MKFSKLLVTSFVVASSLALSMFLRGKLQVRANSTIGFPDGGRVVMFTDNMAAGSKVKLSGGGAWESIYPTNGKQRYVTSITLEKNENLTIEVWDGTAQKALGWMSPDNDVCGTGAPLPPTNGSSPGSYAKVNISKFIKYADDFPGDLVSVQCWADWPEWEGDRDYNDFFMIFGYEDLPEPTPTPDPTPTPPPFIEVSPPPYTPETGICSKC